MQPGQRHERRTHGVGNTGDGRKETTEDEDEDDYEHDWAAEDTGRQAVEQMSAQDGTKATSRRFDHEKLDVYRLLLEFIAWVADLLEEVSQDARDQTREIRDQLHRASLSALLNTAEGNGKRRRRIRGKFFDDARGSAMESAACLDALVAMKCCTSQRIEHGKEMLVRIVSMLTRLVERFTEGSAGDVE